MLLAILSHLELVSYEIEKKIVIVLTALDLYTLINFPDICYLLYFVSVSVVTDVIYAVLNELAQNIIL